METPEAPELAKGKRNPWYWVPSLYFAQGVPYVIVMTMSVIMYKRLWISLSDIALYTSLLYLPWVIKPLWSPLGGYHADEAVFGTVSMQFLIAGGLAMVAASVPTSGFFKLSLDFWVMAFASATHDIAADGFYMLSMSKHEQAWWVGLQQHLLSHGDDCMGEAVSLVVLAGVLGKQKRFATRRNIAASQNRFFRCGQLESSGRKFCPNCRSAKINTCRQP